MTNKSKYNGIAIATLVAISAGTLVAHYFVGNSVKDVIGTLVDQAFGLGVMWWGGRKYVV